MGERDGAAKGDGLPPAAGLVLGWHARGVADLEPAIVRAWQKFAARSPFWR
jgi:hypothetical protein